MTKFQKLLAKCINCTSEVALFKDGSPDKELAIKQREEALKELSNFEAVCQEKIRNHEALQTSLEKRVSSENLLKVVKEFLTES